MSIINKRFNSFGAMAPNIRVMAKQSKQSLEVQNRIAEYRLRVERKKGEWLQENVVIGTNQYRESTDSTPTLKDIGISRDESSKAQKVASFIFF